MDKICAIMQPTYLPWAGFFNLMHQVDVFVFLDDAKFSKGSWHNRNQVIVANNSAWITLPVEQRSHTALMDTSVRYEAGWPKKHINMIRSCYGKHMYFKELEPLFEAMTACKGQSLSELNISLIEYFTKNLGLSCEIHKSSNLDISGLRSERLLKICNNLNCDSYLSPVGSRDYLEEDGVFNEGAVSLSYQDFIPRFYRQKGLSSFISHMSIVDIVANIGFEASRTYIRGLNE